MTADRSRRPWLFRMVAAGVPVLVGLTFASWILVQRGVIQRDPGGGIRFVRPPLYLEEPGHERTGHRYLYDELLGWRNIPNWQATTNGNPLTINSRGLRDSEHAYEKPAGTRRVLVLGDSYAWGYGVGDDETFSARLETQFTARGEPIEVINTGVSGWGTDQQLLYLREEGFRYQPDVVVLAFFIGNDCDNNVAVRQYELNKPVFLAGLLAENVPVPRPNRSARQAVLQGLSHLDPVQHSVDIIQGISEECVNRGCTLVVMKFGVFLAPTLPYALDLEGRFEAALDAADLDLHYLDLDRQFQKRNLNADMLTRGNDDGHWNALGHERVAEELESYLSGLAL